MRPGSDDDSNMVDSRTVEQRAAAAALLSAVADPVRLQLMERLADGPSCVCDLQTEVPVPSNLLSYHLKVLREAGLIEGNRRGRWIDYSLVEGALDRLSAALPRQNTSALKLKVVR